MLPHHLTMKTNASFVFDWEYSHVSRVIKQTPCLPSTFEPTRLLPEETIIATGLRYGSRSAMPARLAVGALRQRDGYGADGRCATLD